ncbi:hypothetical protein ACFYWN_35425 [Streptomyces sp. NPDC002917]|nr:hypothetical protein OHB03_42925 [Streptomyces sp. NBC_01643]WTF25490.1 hypothetical protein OG955_04100 [Streptomyces sp. NBC_01602]
MYACRCTQCRTTSPTVVTRRGLNEERTKFFHSGHVADGEQVMEPDKFNVFDVPRERWVVGTLMIVVILTGILSRLL